MCFWSWKILPACVHKVFIALYLLCPLFVQTFDSLLFCTYAHVTLILKTLLFILAVHTYVHISFPIQSGRNQSTHFYSWLKYIIHGFDSLFICSFLIWLLNFILYKASLNMCIADCCRLCLAAFKVIKIGSRYGGHYQKLSLDIFLQSYSP